MRSTFTHELYQICCVDFDSYAMELAQVSAISYIDSYDSDPKMSTWNVWIKVVNICEPVTCSVRSRSKLAKLTCVGWSRRALALPTLSGAAIQHYRCEAIDCAISRWRSRGWRQRSSHYSVPSLSACGRIVGKADYDDDVSSSSVGAGSL